eukprot:2986762-Pyramimonas_sp.AAC.1
MLAHSATWPGQPRACNARSTCGANQNASLRWTERSGLPRGEERLARDTEHRIVAQSPRRSGHAARSNSRASAIGRS